MAQLRHCGHPPSNLPERIPGRVWLTPPGVQPTFRGRNALPARTFRDRARPEGSLITEVLPLPQPPPPQPGGPKPKILEGVKSIVAVASGKGGVGKSTVATNLALALAGDGSSVGLMDADIYGPSIPLMLGINKPPSVTPERKLIPLERFGLKLVSMGFLTNDDSPIIWRGPMVHGIVQQFLSDVLWGDLDYLIIDLPPGTGDAQLTLTQVAPLSGAVIVTTPQDVALLDARKGLRMFEQVNVKVLGIVENMSTFVCPHCGKQTDIFSTGGGEQCAAELGVPFLGRIPIDPAIRECGDTGKPIVAARPEHAVSKAFAGIARGLVGPLEEIRQATPLDLPLIR